MLNNRFFIFGLLVAATTATVFLTAAGGFAWSAVSAMGARDIPAPIVPIPRLSESLRVELNRALTPEFPFNFDTVGNPFADQSGVSLAVGKDSAPGAGQTNVMPNTVFNTAAAATIAPPKTSFPNQSPMPNYPSGYAPGLPPGATLPPPAVQTAVNTNELLKERSRQVKLGKDVPTLASYYKIDDVRPYGVVGSGASNKVKIYAAPTGARFSVSKGTRFADGTVESIGDEGVSFRRDGSGEVVFNRWMKNKGKAAGGNMQADAPVLRVERLPAKPQITENFPR